MCYLKLVYLFNIYFFLLISRGAAQSDNLSKQMDWTKLIHSLTNGVAAINVEWEVIRELPPKPLLAKKLNKQFDDQFEALESPSEREKFMHEERKKSMLKHLKNKRTIPININLRVYEKSKYVAKLEYLKSKNNIEYYSSGNGLLYDVDKRNKEIRLNRKPWQVLREISRGIPLTALFEEDKQFDKFNAEEETDKLVTLISKSTITPGYSVKLILDKENYVPVKLSFYFKDKLLEKYETTKNNKEFPWVAEELSYNKYNKDGAVVWEETWKLVEVANLPSLNVSETEYQLKPGYLLLDETFGERKVVKTDNLLKH